MTAEEKEFSAKECIEQLKKDFRKLPCQGQPEDCLQDKAIEEIKEGMRSISPLLQVTAILNEKQDIQQNALERIESKVEKAFKEVQDNRILDLKELSQWQLGFATQIAQIITEKDTQTITKAEIREIIKWTFGIVVAALTVYAGIRAIISAIL
jgi:hypothetical protein